jgi:hypothetical protein
MNQNQFKFIVFFIGIILSIFLIGCSNRANDSGAVMFHSNLSRTGEYPKGGPVKLTELFFKFKTEGPVDSSPAVSGDVVYFGSGDKYLYAVDIKTGQEKWKFKTEGEVFASPAVSGGVVYFGSLDGYLYAVK